MELVHAFAHLYEARCVDCGGRCYAIPEYIDQQRCEICIIRHHRIPFPMDRIKGMRPRPRHLRPERTQMDPNKPSALCHRCGVVLDPVHIKEGFDVHPICDKKALLEFQDVPGEDALKHELTNMFLWAERNSPRSKQVAPGPSEIGDPCDRRLGMKIAGLPVFNKRMDPWPAIVGTAIHSWSEKAVLTFQRATGVRDWLTEQVVELDPMIQGHSDLYHIPRSAVVDLKTAGTDAMKKIHLHGPPEGYITQVHLYGLGYENSGIPVKEVALAFVPRNGWLSDMRVYSWPYDRSLAEAALARMYRIAARLLELDILANPHRWIEIEPTPGRNCAWCPFYDPREPDQGPGADGCGGR